MLKILYAIRNTAADNTREYIFGDKPSISLPSQQEIMAYGAGAPVEPVGRVEERRPKAPVGSRRIFPPQFKLQVSFFTVFSPSLYRPDYTHTHIHTTAL